MTYVAYSVASHTALSAGDSVEQALDHADRHLSGDRDFVVVFSTAHGGKIEWMDGGRWPADAVVAFRGANRLAQSFRA